MFVEIITFFSSTALERVSMSNQEWKIRPKIFNIKNVYPFFYLYSLQVSKCSGSCKNINDPYAKLCVPDVVKNINI